MNDRKAVRALVRSLIDVSQIKTRPQVKDAAKQLRKLLKTHFNQDVKHGHCLDMVSQALDQKDWNVVSALLPDESLDPSEMPTEDVNESNKA